MTAVFNFSLSLGVFDKEALFKAAYTRATDEGLAPSVALDLLTTDGTNIDQGACVSMLLDPGIVPGCSINGSTTERVDLDFNDTEGEGF